MTLRRHPRKPLPYLVTNLLAYPGFALRFCCMERRQQLKEYERGRLRVTPERNIDELKELYHLVYNRLMTVFGGDGPDLASILATSTGLDPQTKAAIEQFVDALDSKSARVAVKTMDGRQIARTLAAARTAADAVTAAHPQYKLDGKILRPWNFGIIWGIKALLVAIIFFPPYVLFLVNDKTGSAEIFLYLVTWTAIGGITLVIGGLFIWSIHAIEHLIKHAARQ